MLWRDGIRKTGRRKQRRIHSNRHAGEIARRQAEGSGENPLVSSLMP